MEGWQASLYFLSLCPLSVRVDRVLTELRRDMQYEDQTTQVHMFTAALLNLLFSTSSLSIPSNSISSLLA